MLNSMLDLLDAILDKYMILRKDQETDTYEVQICYIKVFVESIYIYSAENLAIWQTKKLIGPVRASPLEASSDI